MDLLAPGKESVEKKLRELPKQGFQVVGAESIICETIEQVFDSLAMGNSRRKVCGTGMNARSSRSHTIFIIDMETSKPDGSVANRRLNLVDLAGSERISKTGATGDTLKEAQKINLSLTTLGMVISKLVKGDSNVPFRDSSLTKLLKESLGGNAKTCLICTMSMKDEHFEETVQTLEFANRARAIKCKAKVNVQRSAEELERIINTLQSQINQMKDKVKSKGLDPKKILAEALGIEGGDVEKEGVEGDGGEEIETPADSGMVSIGLQAKIDSLKEKHIQDMIELNEMLENSNNPESHELVQKLVENLNEKNGELVELTDKYNEIKQKSDSLQKEYEEASKSEELNDLEIKLDTQKRNLKAYKDELSQITQKKMQYDNEIELMSKKLDTIKEDCDKLTEEINEHTVTLNSLMEDSAT